MAILDTDNFIVSDNSTGTNYRISALDLATFVNGKAGASPPSGNAGGQVWCEIYSASGADLAQNEYSIRSSQRPSGFDSDMLARSGVGAVVGGLTEKAYIRLYYQIGIAPPASTVAGYITSYIPNNSTLPTDCYGGFYGGANWFLDVAIQPNHSTLCSFNMQELSLSGGSFFFMSNQSSVDNYWANLTTLSGSGYWIGLIPSSVTSISTTSMGGFNFGGELDFRGLSIEADNIKEWLSLSKLNTIDTSYFKTIRFDGGANATYEDLDQPTKDRITELQGLGWTLVLNGTGDGSVVNVANNNGALIYETSDNRFIPIAASTSAAVFPATGGTAPVQYADLATARSAMIAHVGADFDSERLYGGIANQIGEISPFYTERHSLGSAVSLDATIAVLPAGMTVTYQWYKETPEEGLVAIPNAEDPIIETASLTTAQLGNYNCVLEVSDPATGRSLTYRKDFVVSEPLPVASPASLMGQNAVDSVSLLAAGTGYTTNATGVATSGGSGSGLTVDITTDGDAVLTVAVNFPGTGYVDGENLTIVGGNNDAIIDITVN